MQQTSNGDATDGGMIQPLYGAVGGNTTASSIKTVGVLSSTTPRPRGEVFGFAFGNASLADPTYGYPAWSMNLLTTIAYFGLTMAWDGSILQSGSGWTTWNSSQLTGLVSVAHANGVRVILSINLHDFSAKNNSTMCAALHPRNRATTVAATAAQIAKMGVDGVNIDYEGTNTTCYYGATLQSEMTALVREMRAKLPKAYIAVDTYSGSAGDSTGFFNIPDMAPYVDSFFVMAYDMEYSNWWHIPLSCSSFCLGPTAPLTGYQYNDTKSMTQYTAVVPASKVILGVPYYGRKECVASVTPTTAPPNAKPVSGTLSDGYLDAAAENGYPLNSNYHSHREVHDTTGFERWDTWYSSASKCTREMYWDDAVSLGRKYDLVNKMALRGVGIFALQYGGGAPALWDELQAKFVGCLDSTLTASPSAPEPPGAVIRFTAASTGCSKPRYEFWVQYPDGKWVMTRGFSTGNTWYWNTAGLRLGTYKVHVWANQTGNPMKSGEAIAEFVQTVSVIPNFRTARLATPSADQAVATSVGFTASSTACGTPAYAYWVQLLDGKWHLERGFSLDPTWTFNTTGLRPGAYKVRVFANQYGHSMAHPEASATSTVTLTGCTGATLAPPTAAQAAGTTVAFTATSAGCATPQYEYWVQLRNGKWVAERTFSADGTWSWDTTGLAPGTYPVHVWANQLGAYTGALESVASSTVTLGGCASAAVTPVNPTLKSGTALGFTAASGGCATPQYEYWVQYPNGAWHLKRAFAADATWSWDTTGLPLGTYTVHVWANQQGAFTGALEAVGSTTVRLAPPCSSASLSPLSGSTVTGGSVTFTASATGCPNPAFEFWVQYPDGTWHMTRAFSPVATWKWTTSGLPKGTYHVHVWANEPGSNMNAYQVIGAATRTIT
jgi:spore germination protein YaaH